MLVHTSNPAEFCDKSSRNWPDLVFDSCLTIQLVTRTFAMTPAETLLMQPSVKSKTLCVQSSLHLLSGCRVSSSEAVTRAYSCEAVTRAYLRVSCPRLLTSVRRLSGGLQGDPGDRLLRAAELLTSAAELAGSLQLAALASRVMQTISLACVATGVPADAGPGISKGADGSRTAGQNDSWHLTVSQYGHLTRLCLLLAQRHPSLDLLQQLAPATPSPDEQALFPWEGAVPPGTVMLPSGPLPVLGSNAPLAGLSRNANASQEA